MRVRKSFFTLLEVLVVLTILSFVAGVIGINVYKIVAHERFQSEVSLVARKLQQAQDFVMVYGQDASVYLIENEGYHLCRWKTEYPIDHALKRHLNRKEALKWIDKIVFTSEEGESQEQDVVIKFYAWKGTKVRGRLTLSSTGGSKSFIDLPGHPSPLVVGVDRLSMQQDERERGHVYPKEFL